MSEDYIIIVAGGKGLRMGGDIPKQFLPVGGLPVLMRTMMRFRQALPEVSIILVLPKAQQNYWQGLCAQHRFNIDYQLADGGKTRFHSVQNGLALVPDDAEGVVGVHDGVRPFVSVDVIRRCYEQARTSQAVIPVVPVVETVRRILPDHTSVTVPRDEYRLVQTPQCFDIQLLKTAYKRAQNQTCLDSAEREQARPKVKAANRQPYTEAFTDDASVVEAYGHAITLVDGNRENIKITTPGDLKIAETLI